MTLQQLAIAVTTAAPGTAGLVCSAWLAYYDKSGWVIASILFVSVVLSVVSIAAAMLISE